MRGAEAPEEAAASPPSDFAEETLSEEEDLRLKAISINWDADGEPDEEPLPSPGSTLTLSSGPVFNNGPMEDSLGYPNSAREEVGIVDIRQGPVERNDSRARVDALMAAQGWEEKPSTIVMFPGGTSMETESTAQGQLGGEIACGLYSVECRGIDPCISAAHSSTACLSSTLDEAMAASSTTTACLFGLEQVDEEAARGTHTQHQAMADDDGDLAVPELGKWVEALIQDLEVRLGPEDSAAYQMLTSTQSSMRLLTKGASRASFAVRRATGRTTCSDSSKMTVRDCATSGSKDIN